jgi:hypothetical protein
MAEKTEETKAEPKGTQFTNPGLDEWFKADEEEIQQLSEHPAADQDPAAEKPLLDETTEETPEEKPSTEEPPAEEKPAVEEPPPEEKPATEEPPPEEKPAEQPPPKKHVGPSWKQVKELQRALKEANDRLAAKPAEVAPPPPREDELADPIEVLTGEVRQLKDELKKTQEQTEQKVQQLTEAEQRQKLQQELIAEESLFERDHPDYRDAVMHLISKRTAEYERTGRLDNVATYWLSNHADLITRHALETGRDPEDEGQLWDAARDIGLRTLIDKDRHELVTSAKQAGRRVTQVVYELAKDFGYQGKAKEPAAPPVVAPEKAAQARVAQAIKQKAVTQSLAGMQTSGAAIERKLTRDQFLKMTDEEQDRLVAELDEKDPGWHERLI